GDGVAEVTLAYRLLCHGGVDADNITVVVLAGKEKYVLFGKDRVQIAPDKWIGGDIKKTSGPKKLAAQAKQTFEAIVKRCRPRPRPAAPPPPARRRAAPPARRRGSRPG